MTPSKTCLWAKIASIQRNAPIADITIITLKLEMIEETGLLASTTEKFCLRPLPKWTVAPFVPSFNSATKNASAGDAGFRGAHNVVGTPTPAITPTAVAAAAITPAPAVHPPATRHVTMVAKFTTSAGHMVLAHIATTTPSRCAFTKAAGHQHKDATAFWMNGGNNTISFGRPHQLASASTN